MTNTKTIAANANTGDTTPRHIWMHQVFTLANVSVKDAVKFCGRARLNLWHSSGEPVWMAADGLRIAIENGKRDERNNREVSYLAGKMKVG